MLNSTWLEELASESNTIQAQEDIMSARVMASNIRAKLYVRLGWLFDHISGLMCLFELTSFVASDMVSLLAWIDCSGVIQKIHMRKMRLDQGFVDVMKMMDFMIRGP